MSAGSRRAAGAPPGAARGEADPGPEAAGPPRRGEAAGAPGPGPRRGLRSFARAEGGIAAVEFALVLPLMLGLYLGSTELSQYIGNVRKVTLAARTMADLVSRESGDVSQTALGAIFKAARAVLSPFDASTATFTIKAVGVYDATGRAKICSSAQSSGAAGTIVTPAASTTLPAVPGAYMAAGARYVLVEITMPYKPVISAQVANWTMTEQVPWPVRNGRIANSANPEIILPNGTALGTPCTAAF
ncbi:hypothetical protein OPKNFCMD_0704 [Methylobacterium crusticola]|uniref:TadE-like domain-containing protein n=1 Tax=Methylobacterium crusticola TaxID=1697972 RepID=A0ABQ4QTJ2_9HYPH|nr:TadE/TadG family type IV pilus assembly protein [Methylobacterium crusticola]GJD47991.1 hypothetical protein OPKNFCMD_0704 [Methylobacterium crusticola]